MHMANIEGLQETLAYITEHPDEWDQQRWSTCFAGISPRLLAGATFTNSDCCPVCRDLVLDGKIVSQFDIPELARDALGLTAEQATQLFAGMNDLDHVTGLIAEFTADQPALTA